jgi:hypothetical protein
MMLTGGAVNERVAIELLKPPVEFRLATPSKAFAEAGWEVVTSLNGPGWVTDTGIPILSAKPENT